MTNDLVFPSWGEWAEAPSDTIPLLDPLVLKYEAHPAVDFHYPLKDLTIIDLEQECSFNRSPSSSGLLSPLTIIPGFRINSVYDHDDLPTAFERSCGNEPCQSQSTDDEDALSPLDWTPSRRSILASPFSEDSDSDDGWAPSPFSSPESISKHDDDGCLFYPPSSVPRYHLQQYQGFESYHGQNDDDASSSESSLSSPVPIPHSALDFEGGLQSPSVLPAPLPGFNSFYYFDQFSSAIPESPLYRAVDLPVLDNDPDSKFGLGLHSTDPSFSFGEMPPPHGISQRTTWLSLPGAETDDDLIPAELGSKMYIPDPSITISTTPPSRSLLIWDPTTSSGLPADLPSFDGTGHVTHRFDVDALPIGRPHSPEEDFDVDPVMLARLAETDAEKGAEVQKLCELKQRANMAAVAACKSRDGSPSDVERVREKCREVTALLRLKLTSDEKGKSTHNERGDTSNGEVENNLLDVSSLSLSSTSPSPLNLVSVLSESSSTASDLNNPSTSTSPNTVRRRPSKPKITSMAQLVANMVLHRQQDALRRSPVRCRTWSPATSTMQTSVPTKTRSLTQTTPTSPLRQMTLPEDLDENDGDEVLDSPLQLSPLCLSLCRSPESFYAQLEMPSS